MLIEIQNAYMDDGCGHDIHVVNKITKNLHRIASTKMNTHHNITEMLIKFSVKHQSIKNNIV
jgi:hypothetical protein